MKIDFVKTLEASSPYTPGRIYFEESTSLIKVATANNQYRVFGGVRSADYDATTQTLTIQNGNGDEVYLDMSEYVKQDSIIYNGNAKIFYGTCSTAAATTQKDVVCSSFTADDLVKGALIFVTFDNTNSGAVDSLTMSVNGTTAKPLKKEYTAALANLSAKGEILANQTYLFAYDGTNWVCQTLDYNTNTNTYQRVYNSSDNTEYPITTRYATTSGSAYYAEYGRYSTGVTLNPSTNTITASKYIVTGGTASQFLKADGTVDSNSYITSSDIPAMTSDASVAAWGYLKANDVSTKVDKADAVKSLSLGMNSSTYTITLSGTMADGSTFTVGDPIDLPLETMVVDGSYNSSTKKVSLGLKNGSSVEFSVADLVAGLQTEITSSNKLSADLIQDGTTNKVVTETDKNKWNNLVSNVQSDWNATSGLSAILNKPVIPDWALATTKPSYTLDEVLDGTTRYLQDKTSINMGSSSYLEITVTDTCILKLIMQLSYDEVDEGETYHNYMSCMYELAISITSSEDWTVSGSILSGSNFLQEYSYQYGGMQRAPILCSYNNGALTVQLALDRDLVSYAQNKQTTANIAVVLGKTSLSCTATSSPIGSNGVDWNNLNDVITDIQTVNNSLRLRKSCYWFNQIPYSSIVTGGGGITGITFNGTAATVTNGVAAITATIPPDNVFIIPVTKSGTTYSTTVTKSEARAAINANKLLFVLYSRMVMPLRHYDTDDYGDYYFYAVSNYYIYTMHLVASPGGGPLSCSYSETAIPAAVTESTVSGWGFTKNTGTLTGVKFNNTNATINGTVAEITATIPPEVTESTVSGWGFTKNAGTLTSHADHKLLIGSASATAASSNTITYVESLTGTATATHGDLTVTPTLKTITIPSEVTESTVSGWGFTKNTGTLTEHATHKLTATNNNATATSGTITFVESLTGTNTATSGDLTITATRKSVTIPAAPGTLKTNNNTAQTTSASEALSGTINLHKVAKTGTYSDLIGLPTIPAAANNATISIQKGGTAVDSFTVDASTNKTINIPNELPAVTASDNGKILKVVSGAWAAASPVTVYSGSNTPNNSTGIDGDIYIQS